MSEKIRIFINVLPLSLSKDLHAYAIDPDGLLSFRIKITKLEAERYLAGGVWALFLEHKLRFESVRDDEYKYIGCLAEEDKEGFYTFTARYKRKDSPPLVELPLPSEERLKELDLI